MSHLPQRETLFAEIPNNQDKRLTIPWPNNISVKEYQVLKYNSKRDHQSQLKTNYYTRAIDKIWAFYKIAIGIKTSIDSKTLKFYSPGQTNTYQQRCFIVIANHQLVPGC